MFYLVLFLICLFISIGVGVLASVSDIRGMVIPNIYSVIVIAAFLAAFVALSLMGNKGVFFSSIWSHLMAAGFMFVVTVLLFAAGTLGAADSKLGSAFALWVGIKGFLPFLLLMTLAGGVLGLVALSLKKWKPVANPAEGSWVALVQGGESKVPYGVAIVFGAVIAFYHVGYFDVSNWSSLLEAGGS